MLFKDDEPKNLVFLENFGDGFFDWKHQKLSRLSQLQELLESMQMKRSLDPVQSAKLKIEIKEIEAEIRMIMTDLETSANQLKSMLTLILEMNRGYLNARYETPVRCR